MKEATKVKILLVFIGCGLRLFFTETASAQPHSMELENKYAHFSECLQYIFTEADIISENEGKKEEIDWLTSQNYNCEHSSPITRRIAVKYLEWGDTAYGDEGNEEDVDKKMLFKDGLKWAKNALRQDSTDHLNYEVMSMAYAATITVSGLKRKAQLADSVRIYAEECVRINPKNDRAYHILGRWHYEVSKLGRFIKFLSKVIFREPQDGSFEKAVEYFDKALALDDIPVHRYWLGMAYLETGDEAEALRQFHILVNLQEVMHNDAFFKVKAKELIEEYE